MAHPGGHGHGGDGVGRREHGLRGEGAHGVEEGEVLGGERRRGEALVGPVVVGVGRVHVVIRLHEAAELRQVAVFAQVHLLVPLPLPPLGPAVFEPHLGQTHRVRTETTETLPRVKIIINSSIIITIISSSICRIMNCLNLQNCNSITKSVFLLSCWPIIKMCYKLEIFVGYFKNLQD